MAPPCTHRGGPSQSAPKCATPVSLRSAGKKKYCARMRRSGLGPQYTKLRVECIPGSRTLPDADDNAVINLASASSQPSADQRARSGPNHTGTRPVSTPYAIVADAPTAVPIAIPAASGFHCRVTAAIASVTISVI